MNGMPDVPHGLLRLFVYGTLRPGQANHERFCRGAISIQPATVLGRLYDLGCFPALEVPRNSILAMGTSNPLVDVAMQEHCRLVAVDRLSIKPGWQQICGDLITFNDPLERLPRLDWLEGFCPKGPCLYCRFLVPVMIANGILAAWTYVGSADFS